MALQEFEMRLLASLPLRDRLERIDIPADQFRDCGRTIPGANQGTRALELDFAMLGPGKSRGAVSKSATFPMQDYGPFA
jgi:hypothetical protein